MNLNISINDLLDITDLVLEIPEYRESIEESISTDNTTVISVKNKYNFCDPKYEKSIFYNKPLSDFYLTITETTLDKIILTGQITEVYSNEYTKGEIVIKNDVINLDTVITNDYVGYTLLDMMRFISIDYDIAINLSDIICLRENEMKYLYTMRRNNDEQYKVINLLTDISEALGIFIYLSNNEVRFKSYNPLDITSYYANINLDDVLELKSKLDYDKIINQYSVKYYLNAQNPIRDINLIGLDSRNINGEKPTKEIEASQENNFQIIEKSGAVNSGENYINRYKDSIVILDITLSDTWFWFLELCENYLIGDRAYQLITKSLNIAGSKCNCEFWSY